MKKHWTSFLSEALTKQGEQQMLLQEKILKAEKELRTMKGDFDHIEHEMFKAAIMDFTVAEIDEAKAKAITTQRTPEEQEAIDKMKLISPLANQIFP